MRLENVLYGTKTGVTFYGALFGAVAQTYDMEQTLAMNSNARDHGNNAGRARM